MEILRNEVLYLKNKYDKLIYINCAAVVHTEHFYHVDRTFRTNVLGMKYFLEQAINVGADIYIIVQHQKCILCIHGQMKVLRNQII